MGVFFKKQTILGLAAFFVASLSVADIYDSTLPQPAAMGMYGGWVSVTEESPKEGAREQDLGSSVNESHLGLIEKKIPNKQSSLSSCTCGTNLKNGSECALINTETNAVLDSDSKPSQKGCTAQVCMDLFGTQISSMCSSYVH